ncbi:ubiquitin-conjugating enzyme/RWD-like protein [Peziza echinospora]|nr:ubiquitin-conjugating enzyme/RWD-like protein [Peziza echinospora]
MPINEEQEQEIEVLQSIYPDELTIISDEELRIRIELESPWGMPAEDIEDRPPTLILSVKYSANYPDVAPNLDLSLDPSCPKQTLDFPDDKTAILKELNTTIEENLGMAMVFTLVTTVKEAAENMLQERFDALTKKREAAALIEEEKEMAKFKGTPVTKETFTEWRNKFFEEMNAIKKQRQMEKDEEEKGRRGAMQGGMAGVEAMKKRMTGKQLYQSGTVGGDDDVDAADDVADLSKLKLQDEAK